MRDGAGGDAVFAGDSLLFTVGAIAARGSLDIYLIAGLLLLAAILGDTVNYWVGKLVGQKLIERYPNLFRPEHLRRTHDFFERYGGKTIIIARFVPIVRTFAPFVAGIGKMTYSRFMAFNVGGGCCGFCCCCRRGISSAIFPS